MQSKIEAASWALANGCGVVICNGELENAIVDTLAGKSIGTLFTKASGFDQTQVEQKATKGKCECYAVVAKNRSERKLSTFI
jgi:glutamate 5-kinase